MQQHREALNKLRAQAKAKRDESEQEKQQAVQEIEALKAERDTLLEKVNAEISSELTDLRAEVQRLQTECAALRLALEEERKMHSENSATIDKGGISVSVFDVST